MRSDYEIIDTLSGLETVAELLEQENAVAVDLEADSMYHFREKVCLIQMATKRRNLVVDPLRITHLAPLKSFFSRTDIQKIFHGADYDIRSLYRDYEITVNNLFDTELACRFVGLRETSLEAVLMKFFNVSLNKKYQKKDWSKRPLPKEMMDYAARDVKYLLPLHDILEKELAGKNRLSWVYEECANLSRVRPALSNDDPLFMKFKGAGRLKPRSLAVLEALLQYRKRVAETKDKPLFKIFSNDSVMKIATAKPATLKRLMGLGALSKKQIDMYGKELIETVGRALKLPESRLPRYPRKKAPSRSPGVPDRIKMLKAWRDKKAGDLDIDPALVCSKAMITAIAVHNPVKLKHLEPVEDMKNWQKTAFGDEIIATLRFGAP